MSLQNTPSAVASGDTDVRPESDGPADVWLYQLVLHHYRLPVWDRIAQLGGDDYRFSVFGPLPSAQKSSSPTEPLARRDAVATSAVPLDDSGGGRDYLRHQETRFFKLLGVQLVELPSAAESIARARPDVVIMTGNIRDVSAWKLPRLCRKLGIATAEWSKVHAHSYSLTPVVLTRPIKRRFYRRFDAHIVYGKQSAAELERLGVSPENVHIAQNTIDTEFLFNNPDAIQSRAQLLKQQAGIDGRRAVVCVGTMVAIKRQLELVEAWPRLRETFDDLVLVLVGGGPMLEEVRRRAAEIDPQRIVVTGRVPDGDDHCWLAASDVAVVPGGAGLSINASLALGRPTVIADEFGADAEIVQDGVTGWRYPLGDRQAMTSAICHALAGGDDVRRVTQNARRLMHEEVTIDNMARGADAAIRQALSISRQRRRRG